MKRSELAKLSRNQLRREAREAGEHWVAEHGTVSETVDRLAGDGLRVVQMGSDERIVTGPGGEYFCVLRESGGHWTATQSDRLGNRPRGAAPVLEAKAEDTIYRELSQLTNAEACRAAAAGEGGGL
jgi:hypothetical protein